MEFCIFLCPNNRIIKVVLYVNIWIHFKTMLIAVFVKLYVKPSPVSHHKRRQCCNLRYIPIVRYKHTHTHTLFSKNSYHELWRLLCYERKLPYKIKYLPKCVNQPPHRRLILCIGIGVHMRANMYTTNGQTWKFITDEKDFHMLKI